MQTDISKHVKFLEWISISRRYWQLLRRSIKIDAALLAAVKAFDENRRSGTSSSKPSVVRLLHTSKRIQKTPASHAMDACQPRILISDLVK